MGKQVRIDEDTLQKLYEDQRLSIREMARLLGHDRGIIRRELARHDIPLRSRSEAGKITAVLKEIKLPKDVLQKLYVEQRLSSYEIGEQLHCDPATVRKELRRHGIKVRSLAEAKKLPGVQVSVGELKDLYWEQELSQAKIAAKLGCSPTTVLRKMRAFNIQSRSIARALQAYPKQDFSGDKVEKAYLIGFRLGDLHVKLREHGQTIRVDCSSTKTEQTDLIDSLFNRYGHIWCSKPDKRGKVVIVCYLNTTFAFLLPQEDRIETWIRQNKQCFLAFAAGYIDAEGCIYSNLSQRRACLQLRSYDKNILHQLYNGLLKLGISCPAPRMIRAKGTPDKRGIVNKKDTWCLGVYSRASLSKLFTLISPYLKHAKRRRDMEKAKTIMTKLMTKL